jgi:hypothetical protein
MGREGRGSASVSFAVMGSVSVDADRRVTATAAVDFAFCFSSCVHSTGGDTADRRTKKKKRPADSDCALRRTCEKNKRMNTANSRGSYRGALRRRVPLSTSALPLQAEGRQRSVRGGRGGAELCSTHAAELSLPPLSLFAAAKCCQLIRQLADAREYALLPLYDLSCAHSALRLCIISSSRRRFPMQILCRSALAVAALLVCACALVDAVDWAHLNASRIATVAPAAFLSLSAEEFRQKQSHFSNSRTEPSSRQKASLPAAACAGIREDQLRHTER